MLRLRALIATIMIMCAVTSSCLAQGGTVHAKILDGTQVSETQYPFVARLNYAGDILCTGTLIASRYVLTAAHCFFDSRNRRSVGNTDIVARMNGVEYASTQVSIHPTYRARSSACVDGEIDAAIIELASDVAGVSPVPLVETASPVGSSILLVGYGNEGTGNTGENGSTPPVGLVNAGTTVIQGYGDSPPAKNNSSTYYFWKFDRGEANTGSGDSGGPAFVYSGNQPYISGITCGGEGNSEFGTYSYNTRADILVTWARAITGSAPSTSAPAFASLNTHNATIGKSFSLAIPVSGSSPIALSATGLPPGLALVDNVIAGTPTSSGTYSVTLSASNAFGSASIDFAIVVAAFSSVLKVSAAELVFDNDRSSDYLAIGGRIGVGSKFKPDKAKVVITIGRYSRTFKLNRKGESTGSSWSYFDLSGTIRSGRFTKSTLSFELAIDRSDLFQELTILGFPETSFATTGQKIPLPLAITINGIESSVTENLKFDGKEELWVLSR
jgi:secreted trypsin-like serine protease